MDEAFQKVGTEQGLSRILPPRKEEADGEKDLTLTAASCSIRVMELLSGRPHPRAVVENLRFTETDEGARSPRDFTLIRLLSSNLDSEYRTKATYHG